MARRGRRVERRNVAIAVGPLVVGLMAVGLAAGCRDAPDPFDPPGLSPLGPPPYRLTFDPGREVAPAWTASGDSVVYVSQERSALPTIQVLADGPVDTVIVTDTVRTRAVLRAIPAVGGVAGLLLPLLQAGSAPPAIDVAAVSPTGRVAAFTLLPVGDRSLCGGVSACDDDVELDTPARLDAAFLRVRDPAAAGAPDDDPLLAIEFPGREFDTSVNPNGLSGLWRVDQHPFQFEFNRAARVPDRISWAPDGQRVVFSDGVRLRTWRPDSGELAEIPGTLDGTNPAWSPTGEWIAFERAERGDAIVETCEHRVIPVNPGDELGAVVCVEERTTWPVLGRTLALVRPDGTDLRLLPAGARPAWSPDGERIYYEFGAGIWVVGIDGVGAMPVPDTGMGYEPAVSPDGSLLAFSRVDGTGGADIWIVETP